MKIFRLLPLVCCFLFNSIYVNAQCPAGESIVNITILADNFPQETSWNITNNLGDVILSSALEPGDSLVTFDGCIPSNECVVFSIFDQYGDGICCSYGEGSYIVEIDGVTVASGGEFVDIESTSISCPQGSSCSNANVLTEGSVISTAGNSWYEFTPNQTGLYEFDFCSVGCGTATIWIYDYCTGLIWDDTNEGSIYYDDDGCNGNPMGAFLDIPLDAEEVYYVRIKYDDETCSSIEIQGEITFNGAVTGCTDPNSCNFEPLATEDDGSCIYPGDPECPDGPDLVIEHDVLVSSMYVAYLDNSDACLIQEGCVTGYGEREVIRFTTHIKNIGNADYYIGQPQDNNQWEWDPCHNHWHYEGYAEYVMYRMDDGTELPIGFKNGFCVMDLECSDGGTAQYGCGNQGISKQCGDIYSSGLQCQWVDITDVEAGDYMLVVKVNWDQSPDVLGRVEMDFENNWTQVCINIARDPMTNEASFTLLDQCEPYEDCQGVIYGNAEPDCNGVCAGVTVMGDINVDTTRTMSDLTVYMLESLLDTISTSTCLDLNSDGEITVTDATLLYDCLLHGTGTTPADHQHTPCEFPYAVQNPNDKATLTLNSLNQEDGYVEVGIKNPTGKVISFEFDVSGIIIDHVTNHVSDYYPNIMYDDNEIIGITYDESFINKNADFIPFLRIYYSTITGNEICIGNITDIVNDDHEEMTHEVVGECLIPQSTSVYSIKNNPFNAKVTPNPSSEFAQLIFEKFNSNVELEIVDMAGKRVFYERNISNNTIQLPVSSFDAGIYIFKLNDGENASVGRFIVE